MPTGIDGGRVADGVELNVDRVVARRHDAAQAIELHLVSLPRDRILPSSVVNRRPPTVSTGPQGECVPGIHLGYQRTSGPGSQAIRRLVCSNRRGRSGASTSIRSSHSPARAAAGKTHKPVSP